MGVRFLAKFLERSMKTLLAVLALTIGLGAIGWGASTPAFAVDEALSMEANQKYLDDNAKKKGVIVRPSGLQFRIIQNGYGKRPAATDTVTVYYTGTLINHVIFDGTSPGLPASMKIGNVIPGWVEALQLMREGDHWLLTIPPNLGYGVRGSPDGGITIPPNQVLVFDIKLISTTAAPRRGEKGYIPDPSEKEDQ
jgi:FKBP-type peptidyl-prolyl cis-trans isomerase